MQKTSTDCLSSLLSVLCALSYFTRNVRTLFLIKIISTTSVMSSTYKVVFGSLRNGLKRYEKLRYSLVTRTNDWARIFKFNCSVCQKNENKLATSCLEKEDFSVSCFFFPFDSQILRILQTVVYVVYWQDNISFSKNVETYLLSQLLVTSSYEILQ